MTPSIENLTTIKFKSGRYVQCVDVMERAPIYSKGSRNTRTLIKKKEIPENMFMFAKQNEEGKWVKTKGDSIKFDKVLLKKEYLINVPELQEKDHETIIVDDKGIKEAPSIINLTDGEKFKDTEGNVVEIEARGDRAHNKIYFKVKDVEKHFDLKCLSETMNKKNTTYKEETDYCYFNCKMEKTLINGGKEVKIKKEMFLTLSGFRKMIEISRIKFSTHNKNIMHKWINQNFDYSKILDFTISIQNDILRSKIGYVYCVTSHNINIIKIGFWRSSLLSLHSRYLTYYGKKQIIHTVLTKDARTLEKLTHKFFSKNCIEGELFDPNNWSDYVLFLEKNKEEPDEVPNINYDNVLNTNPCAYEGINAENDELIKKYGRNIPDKKQYPYICQIGKYSAFRKTMDISHDSDVSDDYIMIECGITENIAEKTSEYEKKYTGMNIKMMNNGYVDPEYALEIDVEMKELSADMGRIIKNNNGEEITVIDPKYEKMMLRHLKLITNQWRRD